MREGKDERLRDSEWRETANSYMCVWIPKPRSAGPARLIVRRQNDLPCWCHAHRDHVQRQPVEAAYGTTPAVRLTEQQALSLLQWPGAEGEEIKRERRDTSRWQHTTYVELRIPYYCFGHSQVGTCTERTRARNSSDQPAGYTRRPRATVDIMDRLTASRRMPAASSQLNLYSA
jgi:hypothetical protein